MSPFRLGSNTYTSHHQRGINRFTRIDTRAPLKIEIHDMQTSFLPPPAPRPMFTYIKNEMGLFVCPTCEATKKNQSTMFYHMKRHQEEFSHVCKICDKGFLQKSTLELHYQSKHPERTKKAENAFLCPHEDCEFSSLTKGNTIIHYVRVHCAEEMKRIMHQTGKMYQCRACQKEFKNSCGFMYHCKGSCLPCALAKRDAIQTIL